MRTSCRCSGQSSGREYSHEEYDAEFSLRVPENLSKIDRVIESWKNSTNEHSTLFCSLPWRPRESVCFKLRGVRR